MGENQKEQWKDKIRARNFAMVLYDDSCVSDWKRILRESCLSGFSIYHDQDVDEKGELKKAHYHVLVHFNNPVRRNTILGLSEALGASNGRYEVVGHYVGYARYMCHLDERGKHVYDVNEVECYGGADYISVISGKKDNARVVSQIIEYCKENRVYSYADLIEICVLDHKDWFDVICKGTYGHLISEYIKSRYWTDEMRSERVKGGNRL